MTNTFYTIGHSTRSLQDFAELLIIAGVDLVVDVRSMPRSRTNPQFNGERLSADLGVWQIGYEHIAELGGLRGRQPASAAAVNGYWRVKSFRNYADYALTPAFARGFDRLRALGARRHCAIMCAEVLWWRCHRRIIADYLIASGERVVHILGAAHMDEARLTPGAVACPDQTLVYPATT